VADATFTKPPLGGAAAGEGGGDVTPAASRSLLQRCHTTAGLRNAGFFSAPRRPARALRRTRAPLPTAGES